MAFHIYTFTERAHRHDTVTNRSAAMTVFENAREIDAVRICLVYNDNEIYVAHYNLHKNKQEILEPVKDINDDKPSDIPF
jgi:hypothetical protein